MDERRGSARFMLAGRFEASMGRLLVAAVLLVLASGCGEKAAAPPATSASPPAPQGAPEWPIGDNLNGCRSVGLYLELPLASAQALLPPGYQAYAARAMAGAESVGQGQVEMLACTGFAVYAASVRLGSHPDADAPTGVGADWYLLAFATTDAGLRAAVAAAGWATEASPRIGVLATPGAPASLAWTGTYGNGTERQVSFTAALAPLSPVGGSRFNLWRETGSGTLWWNEDLGGLLQEGHPTACSLRGEPGAAQLEAMNPCKVGSMTASGLDGASGTWSAGFVRR
jgi:hypothetical protein